MSNHHRKCSSNGGSDAEYNISHPKQHRHELWHALFRNYEPEKIVEEINEIWIDSEYEVILVRRNEND
jgi:hypothetical protein